MKSRALNRREFIRLAGTGVGAACCLAAPGFRPVWASPLVSPLVSPGCRTSKVKVARRVRQLESSLDRILESAPPVEKEEQVVVTGKPADRYLFKVPSLRNVARTAPYFHDGSVADLAGAIRRMARSQLCRARPQ